MERMQGGGIKIRKGGGGSVYCMNVNIKWSGIEIKDYNWTSALLCSSILYSLYILVYICIFYYIYIYTRNSRRFAPFYLALEGASRPSSKLIVNMFSLCTS